MQSTPSADSPFSSVVGLGAFVSEHKPSTFNRWAGLAAGCVFVIAAPALLLAGFYLLYDAYIRTGLYRLDESLFWLPLLCGVIGAPIGLYGLFQSWRNWGLAAALYEGGFAYHDRKGLRQIKWGDIDATWQSITKYYRYGIHTGTTYIYTIQLNDKSRIVLDNKFPKIESLGKAITNGSANALFPRYVAALKSGQRVTFGPIAMDINGLYSGNKSLQWKDIKAIKTSQGIISVRKEGGWFNWATVTVPQVPNFWVFLDLVSRFTKVE